MPYQRRGRKQRTPKQDLAQQKNLSGPTEPFRKEWYDIKQHPATAFTGNVKTFAQGNPNKESWLKKQEAHAVHAAPPPKNLQRTKTFVGGLDDTWQCDLVDMTPYVKWNRGWPYLLTCIDVLSRYAWARPIKSKAASDVAKALEDIFQDPQPPRNKPRQPRFYIQTDQGKEFIGKPVKDLLKRYGVELYHSQDRDTKASLIERYNRTLKEYMWRYFTATDRREWVNLLPYFIKGYNMRPHSAHGLAPKDVTEENHDLIQEVMLYPPHNELQRRRIHKDLRKFPVGTYVRIATDKSKFTKGFLPRWQYEIFRVRATGVKTPRAVFYLEDLQGEEITGIFVAEQLQRVEGQEVPAKHIQKVLNKRKGLSLVKYVGYPDKFNQWVPNAEVEKARQIEDI